MQLNYSNRPGCVNRGSALSFDYLNHFSSMTVPWLIVSGVGLQRYIISIEEQCQ